MDAKEIFAACKALGRSIGPEAYVVVDVTSSAYVTKEAACTARIYPRGVVRGVAVRVEADTFEEVLQKLAAAWDARKAETAEKVTKSLALEIIRITTDLGYCTDAALSGGGDFTREEITLYGAEACEAANEMAGRGPFKIVPVRRANAA